MVRHGKYYDFIWLNRVADMRISGTGTFTTCYTGSSQFTVDYLMGPYVGGKGFEMCLPNNTQLPESMMVSCSSIADTSLCKKQRAPFCFYNNSNVKCSPMNEDLLKSTTQPYAMYLPLGVPSLNRFPLKKLK
eukprot:PhF_6_TR22019/c0_g1_i1/m.31280